LPLLFCGLTARLSIALRHFDRSPENQSFVGRLVYAVLASPKFGRTTTVGLGVEAADAMCKDRETRMGAG
jgi:hypothetical protein